MGLKIGMQLRFITSFFKILFLLAENQNLISMRMFNSAFFLGCLLLARCVALKEHPSPNRTYLSSSRFRNITTSHRNSTTVLVGS